MSLRAIEPADLEWIRAMRNSPAVYAHVRERRLLTEADQRLWYEKLAQDGGKTMRYYVWRQYCWTPSPQGVVGLTAIDQQNRSAEVAVMADPTSMEPEAIESLAEHAFRTLGLHRLYTETITPERAATFKAAGFQQEGVATQAYWRDGRWVDAVRWFRLSTPPT